MPKPRTKASSAKPDPTTALSFVAERDKKTRKLTDNGRVWWSIEGTGDYLIDCGAGARLAEEFLRYHNATREHFILGWIVRDMIAKGRFTGVEVGFFRRISRACPDHPLLRLTSDQCSEVMTKAQLENWHATTVLGKSA
jgi:hypothetical protein